MVPKTEAEFEGIVRSIISENVLPRNPQLYLMQNKKAVDILICRNGGNPALFFIEVKFHKSSHGRLGFGSGSGGGFQPEILSQNPDYFDANMRWVIGDETHGEDGFLFLNNRQICENVSGGEIGQKFNNIQKHLLLEGNWLDRNNFISELFEWMK